MTLALNSARGLCHQPTDACRLGKLKMNLLAGLGISLLTGVVGYLVGIAKDRSNTIHAKKLEAMTKLYERVLEIEEMELSDSKGRTLAVFILPERKPRQELLSQEEFSYMQKQTQWREELHAEERRAGLWLSSKTVHLVSNYLILMMICKTWGEFRQEGSLIEDETFLNCLRQIFGGTDVILKDEKVVRWHSNLQRPWLLNCNYLSDMCLKVIQKRMNLEISLFPSLKTQCQKWFSFNL